MSIISTDNEYLKEAFYDEYKDILILLSRGDYDQVDENMLLKIYYLIFFE